jgi:hypothetical protein
MTIGRRTVLAGGAALAAGLSARAATPLSPYPGGDIALLRQAYTAMHPGLLRYNSTAEIDARFDRLQRDFDKPGASGAGDLASRYLVLSRFLATIRCGHTYANFYNQSDALQKALFSGQDRLPFTFHWIGERMVVTCDPGGLGLARGTEVLAVEGRPAPQVLAGLMTLARADGSNDAERRRLMSVEGFARYESFDVFYPLMFGGRDRYRLRLRTPDGREQDRTLEAIDLKTRRAQAKPFAAAADAAVWTLDWRGETAVLTMPTWGLYDSKWDWKAWLAARFEEIDRRGASRLIIDVRGNEGGLDCGDAVIARLIDAPLPPEQTLRLVRYRRAPDPLWPYLDTWDPSFKDWGEAAKPYDDRFFRLDQKEDDGRVVGEIRPEGPRFHGKVAVLIGAQNSSATFQFADRIRKNRLGVLIGEETGGNRRGINGGAFFFLRLPESGLEADLPVIGAFPTTPQPDAGLLPDISAPLTAEAIAAGRDPAMEAALKMLA